MSKYQSGNYYQIPFKFWEIAEKFKLSIGSVALYARLKALEHRYTQERKIFFHTDAELAKELNTSTKSIERYRSELIAAGLVKFGRRHFVNLENGKQSEKRVGCYEMIESNNDMSKQ